MTKHNFDHIVTLTAHGLINTDKSIKKIINNVVIGQLEKGINKVQSSCIFHTLEEARGYQTINGGTINIITKQEEISTVEIVDVCPEPKNEVIKADMVGYGFRDDIFKYTDKGTLISVKRIYGPKRIKYEKQKSIDEDIKFNITHKYEQIENEYYNICDELRQQDKLLYGDTYKEKSENEKYREKQKYYKLHIPNYEKYEEEREEAIIKFNNKYDIEEF